MTKRSGPVPLALHVAMLRAQHAHAIPALASTMQGKTDWAGQHEKGVERWRSKYGHLPTQAIERTLAAQSASQIDAFLKGVERYQNHPFKRPLRPAQQVWQSGTTILTMRGQAGIPVVLVPSLINPATVLDLLPGVSLTDYLVAQGFQVFTVDWQSPAAAEKQFSLDGYILERLIPALDYVHQLYGKMHLVGYCLGGNLALAAGFLKQDILLSLSCLATPWDFNAMGAAARATVRATHRSIAPLLARTGLMPAEALQALFAQLDPTQAERKFIAFGKLDEADANERKQIERFVALEDWNNSGPPLVKGVAETCFEQFYGENRPGHGLWRVGDTLIEPGALDLPTLIMAPLNDKIVPHASSAALAHLCKSAALLEPQAGHVGMMVGRKAQALCWQPLANWLQAIRL